MRRSLLRQLLSLSNGLARQSSVSVWGASGPIPSASPRYLAGFAVRNDRWFVGHQLFSTETEKPVENEKEDKPEASSKEQTAEESAEQLETELPDSEETEHEGIQAREDVNAILEEKDMALQQLAAQLDEEKKKVLLGLAESENLRTRFARESAQTKKFAVQGFVQNLLGCLDNLDRAIESVPEELREVSSESSDESSGESTALHTLLTGVKMTQKQFQSVLQSNGVERYDPLGAAFDPNEHMARFELDDPTKEPGTVGVVTLCGYKMHDRIIRPAEVGVIRKRQSEPSSEPEEKSEATN